MISAGIIGCGKIAGYFEKKLNPNTHAGAFSIHKSFELTVSYDIVEKKTKKFAEKYKCKSTKDLDEFLNEICPDVISVTTPDKTHYNIVKRILTNSVKPKIIFLEKPACQNREEFEELIELSTSNNIPIIVNLSRRFDDYHSYIKKMIQKKVLGNLINVFASYYGGIRHNGVHLIDTLFYLISDDLKIEEILEKVERTKVKDPTIEFHLKTNKNCLPIYIYGMDEKHYQLFEFEFRFTNGRIRIEDFGNIIRLEKKIINQIGESILKPYNLPIKKKNSSLLNALDIIEDYIKNSIDISKYDLKSNYKTMNLVWEIENEYKNKFKPT